MRSLVICLAIFVVTVFIFSCKQQEDYRKIRSQVVSLHDKVMQDADLAHGQYKALDSVYSNINDSDTLRVRAMMVNIEKANHEMEEWMDHFEPDVSGKDAAESVQYFKAELDKINKLDHRYKMVMVDADHYLDSLHRPR
jgi:cell shape-determining protein MreC